MLAVRLTDLLVQEREMLEEMPLPGRSQDERSRKEQWLKIPRPARAAIRQLHNKFGHKPKEPLIEILKAAKCPEEYIRAAMFEFNGGFDCIAEPPPCNLVTEHTTQLGPLDLHPFDSFDKLPTDSSH